MPEMIPVGNTITPPNPQQGLGMLSGLIGVQQQRQALQTGQYQQQTAAAQAQQQQLAASQQQGVQSFFNSWDPSQHIADDGTTDLDSALQSKEFQSAGNAKPAIMQALLDVKTKQLANKQALAGLNSTVITQLGTQAGALAKDPDVVDDKTDPATGINPGRAKVSELINNFSKLSPDNARVAQQMFNVDKVPQGKLSTAVQALQMRAQSASEQQAAQFPKQMAVSAGANTQLFNVQPSQGIQLGQQPVASVPYAIPPGVATGPGSTPMTYGPGGAGLPRAGGPGGGTPPPTANNSRSWYRPDGSPRTAMDDAPPPNAPGGQAIQQQYANAVQNTSAHVAAVRQSDTQDYGNATHIANVVRQLSQTTDSGPGTKTWHTILGGISGLTDNKIGNSGADYSLINAYLDRQATVAQQSMGIPNTNAGLATAQSLSGTTQLPGTALRNKNDLTQALIEGSHQYRQGLDHVAGFGPNPSPAAVAAYQSAWTQNFDPNAYRLWNAHQNGDQEEITNLQKELGPNGLKALAKKMVNLKSLSTSGQLPQ